MKKSNNTNYLAAILLCFLLSNLVVQGQETEVDNEFQPRLNVELNYELLKDVSLSFSPEIRFDENFSPDNYLFTSGISYNFIKNLKFDIVYRYGINPRDNKSTEYFNRYAFGLTGKLKFNRFIPGLRIKYTNDSDDENSKEQFLRCKAFLKYNIPDCKITPFIATELFQSLDEDGDLYKIRCGFGGSYKVKKNHYLKAAYKFDFFKKEYKNRHIIDIGYKISF